MTEGLQLVSFALGFLVLFTALGSGPVSALPGPASSRLALAPIVGFAIAAVGLTTAAVFLPMATAAWIFLLPAAFASVVWSVRRRSLFTGDWRLIAYPAGVSALAVLLAATPGLTRTTTGPISLFIFDALGYVQADDWLHDHTAREAAPAHAERWDLDEEYGRALASLDQRVGVSAVSAAVSSLLRAEADEVNLACLATLFGLVPLGIWYVARALQACRFPALLGAFFGLSPSVFLLVVDSALANLAGLVLAPPALLLTIRAIERVRVWELAVAAVLVGGLISVFPEFLPPMVIVTALAFAASVLRQRSQHGWRWQSVRARLLSVALLAGVAAAAAPAGLARALVYLNEVRAGEVVSGQPERFITLENVGAWAFGVLHLYQLPRFDLLSDEKRAIALFLPAALAVLVIVGLLQRRLQIQLLVLAPIASAVVLGVISLRRYQDGDCEYCLWKSLTFMLPFLGVGLAVGAQRFLGSANPNSWLRRLGPLAIIVAGAGGLALLYADAKLMRAQHHSPAAIDSSLREIRDQAGKLPMSAHVFLEGGDATAAPKWSLPSMYFLLDTPGQDRISFVPTGDAALYLGAPAVASPHAYYSAGYEYVFTPFSGIRTDRRLIARSGPYALYERAPVDVGIVSPGWSLDPAEEDPIVWIQGPFQLWVSSPRDGFGSLRFSIDDRGLGNSLHLSVTARPLASRTIARRKQCVDLRLRHGLTVVKAQPQFASQPAQQGRATEADPVPPPPKVLGLSGIEARLSGCPSRTRTRAAHGKE